MKNVLAVGIGGFIGAIARYSTGVLVEALADQKKFPYATLVVNVVGCLFIGVLGGLVDNSQLNSTTVQLFLIVGLLGGFTTYSAFGYQTVTLLHEGRFLMSICNVLAHLILGFGAVGVGSWLAQRG